jgi:hypothetical protein
MVRALSRKNLIAVLQIFLNLSALEENCCHTALDNTIF